MQGIDQKHDLELVKPCHLILVSEIAFDEGHSLVEAPAYLDRLR